MSLKTNLWFAQKEELPLKIKNLKPAKPEDVNIPIVVLIDGNSASSEIVAGSSQDMDRAVTCTTSYGKGLCKGPMT